MFSVNIRLLLLLRHEESIYQKSAFLSHRGAIYEYRFSARDVSTAGGLPMAEQGVLGKYLLERFPKMCSTLTPFSVVESMSAEI